MNKLCLIPIIICISLIISSCGKDDIASSEMKTVNLTEKQKQLITKSNAFGFEFFKKVIEISGSDSNLMVSPLSVSMALGMTRNGAAGTTLEAMTNTLGFAGMMEADINESYRYIIETFSSLDPKVKLQIANSIWYRNTFAVEQLFITTNQNYFNAEVSPLDFSGPTAVKTINDWVSTKTNKLIPSILDEIPSSAIMYLVNAVYFKGQWKYQFETKNTADKPFYLSDGTVEHVPSMVQHESLPYFRGTGFEAIELPYNQGNFTMTVLLPDAGKTINDIILCFRRKTWTAGVRFSMKKIFSCSYQNLSVNMKRNK